MPVEYNIWDSKYNTYFVFSSCLSSKLCLFNHHYNSHSVHLFGIAGINMHESLHPPTPVCACVCVCVCVCVCGGGVVQGSVGNQIIGHHQSLSHSSGTREGVCVCVCICAYIKGGGAGQVCVCMCVRQTYCARHLSLCVHVCMSECVKAWHMGDAHSCSHSMSLRLSYLGRVAAVRILSVFADVIFVICSLRQGHGDTFFLSVQITWVSSSSLPVFIWHKRVFPSRRVCGQFYLNLGCMKEL